MKHFLTNHTAIVTGGARGLGRAMAGGLARAGAHVILVGTDGATAQAAAAEIVAQGGKATGLACDISKMSDCERVVAAATALGGALILINNAALGPAHVEASPKSKSLKFWEADEEIWRRVITVNVAGTFLMSRTAAPAMIAQGWGRIVNITTSLDTMQRAANSPYGVTKAAIEAETMIWAQDLKGTGVTVNSLIPGAAADTAFVNARSRAAKKAEGRALLAPEIMVAPLMWLVSRETDQVTGARFNARLWDTNLPPAEAAKKAREAPVIRQSDRMR